MEKRTLHEYQLLDIIKQEFPHISWNLVKIMNEGWDNQVVVLDDEIVFRFPRNEDIKNIHKKEKLLLDLAKKHVKMKIPQYEYLTPNHSVVGYKAIPGKQLSVNLYHALPPETQRLIHEQIGEFLTQLHSIPLEELEEIGYIRSKGTSKEWAKEFKNGFFEVCGGFFTHQEINEVNRYIDALQQTNSEYKTITHGDIQDKNIFIADDLSQMSGIIDFSDAMIADPALDFDRLRNYGSEFVYGIYAHYHGQKDKEFLTRSRFYRKRIFIFELMDAIKRNKDIQRILAEFRQEFFGEKA